LGGYLFNREYISIHYKDVAFGIPELLRNVIGLDKGLVPLEGGCAGLLAPSAGGLCVLIPELVVVALLLVMFSELLNKGVCDCGGENAE
jgi:hypothetical protein